MGITYGNYCYKKKSFYLLVSYNLKSLFKINNLNTFPVVFYLNCTILIITLLIIALLLMALLVKFIRV